MGLFYRAWAQNALATQNPEGLSARLVNQGGGANAWKATLRHNGAFGLRWLTWTDTKGGGFAKRCLENPNAQGSLAAVDTRDVLTDEPVLERQSALECLPNYEDCLFDFVTTEEDNSFWDSPSINFEAHYYQMADVPTVYAGAWYDSYTKATVDNFEALAERKESDHFLIMGAWTHGATWNRTFSRGLDFKGAVTVIYEQSKLRFFDHYLKKST